MFDLNYVFTVKKIELRKIVLHGQVNRPLCEALMICTYKLSGQVEITEAAVNLILQIHPIIVIKQRSGQLSCIAGLRSFQLAVCRLPPSYKIPILMVSNIPSDEIGNISAADVYLTNLLYGLESEAWGLSFVQIWQALELRSNLTPDLNSKTHLANVLGINRRRLSPKQPPLCSELRATLSSNGDDL